MKGWIKILAVVSACSLAVMPCPVRADNPIVININVEMPLTGSATLDVTLRNISDDMDVGLDGMSFDLTGFDPNDETTFWKVANQYLDIEYNSTWNASWGLRIYTKNKDNWPDMWGKPIGKGANGQWDGPPEDPNVNSDDKCTYGGLINVDHLDNPTYRAVLAWQVYVDKEPGKPSAPVDADLDNGTPEDNTDDWNTPWAYLVDEADDFGDHSFSEIGWTEEIDGQDTYVTNYHIVAYGWIGQALAQHPSMPGNPPQAKLANDSDNDGNYDIAVYLAARFVSTDYLVEPAANFVLPAGSYSARMYVDLIHE